MQEVNKRAGEMTSNSGACQSQKKANWHKPQFQRLHLSLDTAFSTGSGSDGTSPTGGGFNGSGGANPVGP